MKILWHSHSPKVKTGYGTPTALWLPKLRQMGHEVVASAFFGEPEEISSYQGIPVVNTDDKKYGSTVLRGIAESSQADLIVTLMDVWVLDPEAVNAIGRPVAHWMPVDTDPLSQLDRAYLARSGSVPVSISRQGKNLLDEAGFAALHVPYAYDPDVFCPDEADRDRARQDAGTGGMFTVGINAANVERKAWPEQLAAVARFLREHPGEVMLFANTSLNGALPLAGIARQLGIPQEAVRWNVPGMTSQPELATWYRSLDVLLACHYGEGFGLPVVESQACGTPVIVTGASPLHDETGLPGRHVACEPLWCMLHQSWWHRPSIAAIHEALEDAFARRGERTGPDMAAVAHARTYSLDAVAPLWEPVLEQAAARRRTLTWRNTNGSAGHGPHPGAAGAVREAAGVVPGHR